MALPFNDRYFRDQYKADNKGPQIHQKRAQQLHYFESSPQQDAIMSEKVFIYHGNIVDSALIDNVDAIVLPANERLWADGIGASGAIFDAAGYDHLQKACNAITEQTPNHSIPNGQSAVTKAFNLNTDFIIHTIAPCQQKNEDLISCYISALDLCVKMGIRSVAFPCIGTGDGNFTKLNACSTALRTVQKWLSFAQLNKYAQFMGEARVSGAKPKWHRPLQYNFDALQDAHAMQSPVTIYDRILNIVFCCFDTENWNVYSRTISKVYPTTNTKHSYLWIDKIRSITEVDDSKMEAENDPKQKLSPLDNLQKMLVDLEKFKDKFNVTYTQEKMTEMVETMPKQLFAINKQMMDTLNCLNKIKDTADTLVESAENINCSVQMLLSPNTEKYKEWNVNDIIVWILSLENGRFTEYIERIKSGLIASEINSGAMLTELSRSDLSVPPFRINSFQIKQDLIQHFQSLK